MGAEFERPWLLLLLPLCAAAVILPYLRRKWDWRHRLHTAIRSAILLLLALSLAGLSFVFPGGRQMLLMAADRSDSMKGNFAAQTKLIGDIEEKKGTLDTGLMAFGGNTSVEYLKGTGRFTGFDTTVNSNLTDIASALSMGSALLPQDSARRLLLITDGRENNGDMLSAARRLSAAGIRMDVAYFPPQQAKEAQVTSLNVPGYLHLGESFEVVATVHSTYATKATLRLFQDRAQAGSQEVDLRVGENRFVYTFKAESDGIHSWTAEISAPGDGFTGNNRADGFTRVIGRPAVLLVADDPAETAALAEILKSAGFIVDRKKTVELTGKLEDYMRYQAAVLCNVPAASIGEGPMAALDSFVRVLGRGLLVTGGQESFALGGYEGTKLEDMLPVKSTIENYMELPKLGLCLVIDKSGSMSEGQYGISKRDLAVEAASRSAQILQSKDLIGVIAYDDATEWVVKMQPAADKAAIQEKIATIRIGGGTMMYTPMATALDALDQSDAQLKHIILLTDGLPADGGFDELAVKMAARGITLSTVAVGKDADKKLMERLATLGGGRSYVVDEFDNIVSIFTKETCLATGAYLQNRIFTPAATASAPAALSAGLPRLHGYVNTTPKQMAEVELVSDRKHVIFARWRYGLGRTAAWTSDVKGLWSQELLASQSAVGIVSNLVSQVMPEDNGTGALDVRQSGNDGVIALDAETGEGASAGANVIAPDGTSTDVKMNPAKPGVFEGQFPVGQNGVYIVRATHKQNGMPDVVTETGLSAGWSREYDLRYDDPRPRLEQAARLTGGTLVASADEALRQTAALQKGRADLTGALLLTALFLFVLEIAMRRMRWDVRIHGWAMALKRIPGPAAKPLASAPGPQPQRQAQPAEQVLPNTPPTSNPAPAASANSAAQALLDKRRQQKRNN